VTEISTEQVGSMHSPEEVVVSETEMANWLQDLDKGETGQIAQVPAIEATSTDITWLHELDEASKKVPESDAVIAFPALSSEPSLIVEQPSISKPEVTSPIGEVNTMPAVTELQNAQADLLEGRIPQAVEKYNALIANGQFVDEIIHDLRDALYKYPVEILIWQALGDAYVRTNRLQDALDAYTQAEELIR
jgi:tetratricopeptide (TPR) repeat protein